MAGFRRPVRFSLTPPIREFHSLIRAIVPVAALRQAPPFGAVAARNEEMAAG